jgi:O-6-methylguanine DNA methyltransferase
MLIRRDNIAYWSAFTSPLGTCFVAATSQGVCRLAIPGETKEHFFVWLYRHFGTSNVLPHPKPGMDCVDQIGAYLAGERTRFEIHLDLKGTAFQLSAWNAVLHIPYGATTSYRDLAKQIGSPKAYQAVGAAVGQNPVPIIVPCHRVLGSDGSLTGYAAGINTKQWLLRHEGSLLI